MADPSNGTSGEPTLGYAEALRELDTILRELEASDVDVDELAERVARASELIATCREKIASARVRIERVTADLDAAADVEPGNGPGDA